MEQIVKIGNTEVPMRCSGATYIFYRNIFHEDLFTALQKIGTAQADKEPLPDGAVETLMKAAYVMARQATKTDKDFVEWLDQFEFLDAVDSVEAVYLLLSTDQQTIEEAKKNNEPQTGE